MGYKVLYASLLSLVILCAAARYVTMQAKQVFDHLGHKEFGSYFEADFNADPTATLHDLMYNGKESENWTRAAEEVGVYLAKFRQFAEKSNVKDADTANFSSPSPLYDWLQTLGSKEAVLGILPDRIREPYSQSVDHLQKRLAEAVNLLQQSNYVCLQNALTKNIKLKDSQIRFDGNTINARYGPDALDSAIFLGDVLLMYFKQTGHLEHKVQYKSVDTAQKFGQALEEQSGRLNVSEDEMKRYWADVSLLTGWEVIRRYTTKDNVQEILARADHDPASVVECGLRLINNVNIKNPNFLVAVALALLY